MNGDPDQRLFVGLPVPLTIAGTLATLQPAAAAGTRPTPVEDLHVTLHFLGPMNASRVRAALAAVDAAAFTLRLGATGHFELRGGRRILFVAVDPVDGLLRLHAAVAEALATTGFTPEARPFVPHITLARLGPDARDEVVGAFAGEAVPDPAREFTCDRLVLFASDTASAGPRYRWLQAWPLA